MSTHEIEEIPDDSPDNNQNRATAPASASASPSAAVVQNRVSPSRRRNRGSTARRNRTPAAAQNRVRAAAENRGSAAGLLSMAANTWLDHYLPPVIPRNQLTRSHIILHFFLAQKLKIITLLTSVFVLMICFLVFSTSPKIQVSDFNIHEFDIQNNSLSYNITFSLNFSNPNNKAHFKLDPNLQLFFSQTPLKSLNISPFAINSGDQKMLTFNIDGNNISLGSKTSELTDNIIILSLLINSNLRAYCGWYPLRVYDVFRVECDVRAARPPYAGLVSSDCSSPDLLINIV